MAKNVGDIPLPPKDPLFIDPDEHISGEEGLFKDGDINMDQDDLLPGRPSNRLIYCYYDDLGYLTGSFCPPALISLQNDSSTSNPGSGSRLNFESANGGYLNNNAKKNLPENRLNVRVNSNGFIRIDLDDEIYIDVTVDNAIRVANEGIGTFIAVNGDDSCWAFKNKCGQATQIRTRKTPLHALFFCNPGPNKFAKISSDGILFGFQGIKMAYKMDDTGTETIMHRAVSYLDKEDHTKKIMMHYSAFGNGLLPVADRLKSKIRYHFDRKTQNWIINDIKIMKNTDGLVKVWKGRYTRLAIEPNGGSYLYVKNEKCSASYGQKRRHLFVKSASNSVYYNENRFSVRYKNQDSGFEGSNNTIKLFK